MAELQECLDARNAGREVRVQPGSNPIAELKDLHRRQEALKRAVELRGPAGIGKVRVGWTADPDSFSDYDGDAELLAEVETEIEALELRAGRSDPPDSE